MVSARPLNTLISPLFSATNTRPSGEKRTAVGIFSPLNTVVSVKPCGKGSDGRHAVVVVRRVRAAVSVEADRVRRRPGRVRRGVVAAEAVLIGLPGGEPRDVLVIVTPRPLPPAAPDRERRRASSRSAQTPVLEPVGDVLALIPVDGCLQRRRGGPDLRRGLGIGVARRERQDDHCRTGEVRGRCSTGATLSAESSSLLCVAYTQSRAESSVPAGATHAERRRPRRGGPVVSGSGAGPRSRGAVGEGDVAAVIPRLLTGSCSRGRTPRWATRLV